MPSTEARRAPNPETLRARLAVVRRRLRLVAAFRGSGWLLAILLASATLTGLLDWRFHLPSLVRALFLLSTLTSSGLIALRYLVLPLADRVDDLTLALRVEERFPGFNDALASTVQFLDQPGPEAAGASDSLRRAAVNRTLGRAQGLDFTRVVDRRGLRAAVLSAAAAITAVIGFVVLDPALAATAVVRFAEPFGTREWPRLTQIEVDAPRQRVGRNEAFEVRARLRGIIPEQASAAFHFEGLPPVTLTVEVAKEGTTAGHLLIRLPPDRVQRSFHFRVSANDAVSDEYVVAVLPPPVLVPLGPDEPSPHVKLFYPPYTDLPSPAMLPAGTGNIEAIAGTAVNLRARADRPLRRAVIEFLPEDRFTAPALLLATLGANHGLAAAAAIAAGQTVWAPLSAVLEPDRQTFAVDFLPRSTGLYSLQFEDESGLTGSRLFELHLRADPAPTIQLERPAPARDLLTVLPDATLTLQAAADDPVFAVRSVFLEYRISQDGVTRRLQLYNPRTVAPDIAPAVGVGVGATPLRPRPTRVEINQPLPVQLLTHPDGSAPREGDVILIVVGADDFDDVSIDKQPVRSHEVEIRVVGREILDVELNKEQTRLQQEILRLREKQREALAKVTAVDNDAKKGERFTQEQFDQVLQAEQSQTQLREQIGTEKEGLRARALRVLETLRQNHLDNSPERDRDEKVLRELDRLAADELEQAEAQLAAARTAAELQEDRQSSERRIPDETHNRETKPGTTSAEKTARERAVDPAKSADAPEKSSDLKSKSRAPSDAEPARKQPDEQRKSTRERGEPRREQRESADAKEPVRALQALAEARRHQEEIEKTLTDLLQSMEPWTSSREIKGEAGRLLQEQQKVQAAVEELMEKKDFPRGESRDKLTDSQKADLDTQEDAQKKVAERTSQLLEKMQRVAEERKEKDPDSAQELQDARDRALKENVAGQMKDAAEQVRQNQLSDAGQNQKASIVGLKQLLKDLEERREAELERLAKKSRQAEKELDQLFQEQERLKKKMKEAEGIADPKARQEALQSLHRRQQELAAKSQELLQRLTRDRGAGRALANAGEQMERAAQQLSRGEKADEAMDDALDRLDEARAETEQATDRAEEELSREQRARVADLLKRLKERQEALSAEAERIQRKIRRALENNLPTRPLLIGDGGLRTFAGNQRDLGVEVAALAKKELTAAPVFSRLVTRSSEAMVDAGKRVDEVAAKLPAPDALPDEEVARLQAQALRRLEQVMAALKDDHGASRLTRGEGGGGGSGGSAGGGGDDSIPPTAELKVLRKLQEDVNRRTEAFVKEHPDLKKMDEKAQAELKGIRNDQQDVAELLEQLQSGGQPEAAEGGKP